MKFSVLTTLLLLISVSCGAETRLVTSKIKVAVVDTGLDLKDPRFQSVLCPTGHKDFTGRGIEDRHGHGTHMAGLIKQYAKDADYCLIIIKYFPYKKGTASPIYKALEHARDMGADFVNLSGGGKGAEIGEADAISSARNTTFVVAAGNDSQNLDEKCDYFPACYYLRNVYVVGALGRNGKRLSSSNYGSVVDFWELGENVLSALPEGTGYLSGSSIATAIHTGKLVYAKARR